MHHERGVCIDQLQIMSRDIRFVASVLTPNCITSRNGRVTQSPVVVMHVLKITEQPVLDPFTNIIISY